MDNECASGTGCTGGISVHVSLYPGAFSTSSFFFFLPLLVLTQRPLPADIVPPSYIGSPVPDGLSASVIVFDK